MPPTFPTWRHTSPTRAGARSGRLGTFDADPWAIAEAMPSNEEIRRVKCLIERVKADLDDLDEVEHSEIEQAVALVRRGRATMLGMPRLHPDLPETERAT